MLKIVVETIWQDLFNDNFAVPPRRAIEGALTKGFGAPPSDAHWTTQLQYVFICPCAEFPLVPIIYYIEPICRGEAPEWAKSLGLNQAANLSEMIGIVRSIGDTLEMDMFIYFIQQHSV